MVLDGWEARIFQFLVALQNILLNHLELIDLLTSSYFLIDCC